MMETSTDDGVSSPGSTKTRLSNNERKSVEKVEDGARGIDGIPS